MLSKRGVTETQFNWIFISIAGAIILLFFFSVVQKQRSVAEQKSDITIQKNLKSIITGAEVSKQTERIISIPDKEIIYGCEGFSLGQLAAFNPRVVFAPDLLKSNKKELIFYSLEWRVPFRITNFLYVTSPEVRYIIIDKNDNSDDDLIKELKDLLPENINKEIIEENKLNSIIDKNNYKIKIISFNKDDNINNIKNKLKGDISEVNIYEIHEGIDGYGKIEIDNTEVTYLKKESIIGAIFSENAEIYECNMDKAMKRLRKVYEVYENRVDELKNYYMSDKCKLPDCNPDCKNYYDLSFNLKNTYENIYKNNMKDIEKKNQIIAMHSCALIY